MAGVVYLTDDQREHYRLFVHKGRLHRADTGRPFDTRNGAVTRAGSPGRAIFVMDSQANLYVSVVEIIGQFQHSSLLAGQPVAGAGELVVHDGILIEITGRCPGYAITPTDLRRVLTALEQQGLDITSTSMRPPSSTMDD